MPYAQVTFIGVPTWTAGSTRPQLAMKNFEVAHDPGIRLYQDTMRRTQTPFSANSESYYAKAVMLNSGKTLDVFVKSGVGVDHEASSLPILRQHFPQEMLQHQLAHDTEKGRLIYPKFSGLTCSEIKLEFMNNGGRSIPSNDRGTFKLLLNAELIKAEAVVCAQLETIRLPKGFPNDPVEPIHRLLLRPVTR